MILDDIFESALPSRPTLSEGVIDRLKNIYMGLVYDTPLGTPDSEFLAQWQRIIKDKLGQDIDWDTLANLQQHWREQGRRMTRRGDLGKWYREMGMRESGVAKDDQEYQDGVPVRKPATPKPRDEYQDGVPYKTSKSKGVSESIEDTRRQANLKKKIDAGRATDAEKKEYQALKAKNTGKKQGMAKGSTQRPIVVYKELSPDMVRGRGFFQVVQSQSPFWKVGETFSDDDMSMGSQQVRFILEPSKEKGVAEAIPSHIKPSDIPPAMRSRKLTMRDIEAERPQSAYRFRVGDKSFMDLAAAQEFATGTGQRVERIREAAGQKKSSNPRIERILKQLRARHPQAQDDLEALIYDFRSEQAKDDRDIARLDMENDMEEADIERLEQILANLKQQRSLAEKRDRSPGKITRSEDPCWSGYHMVGTKKKAGREVPNCVPGAKGATNEAAGYAVSVRRAGPNETVVAG